MPPPSAMPHVTVVPLTALPNASVTLATMRASRVVLTLAICVLPLSTTMIDAVPAVRMNGFVVARVPSVNERVAAPTRPPTVRPEKKASPDEIVAVAPLETVPDPVQLAAIVPAADVTVFAAASTTLITGCVTSGVPAAAVADGAVLNCSAAAAPGPSVTLGLTTPASPVLAPLIVYAPTLSSVTPEKVATPATAATEIVPPIAPAAGPVALISVTVFVALVTRLFDASRISTTVGKPVSDVAAAGGAVWKASAAAAPGPSASEPLMTGDSPAAAAPIVYVPTLSSVTPENVATPATAAIEMVPPTAPAAGPVALLNVTVFVALVTMLFAASRISTTVAKPTSDVALAGGGAWKPSSAGAPGPMLNGDDSAPVSPVAAAASL